MITNMLTFVLAHKVQHRGLAFCVVGGEGSKDRYAYILAPQQMTPGDIIQSGPDAGIKTGNSLPLSAIPVGTALHNVEMHPGRGGQLARSAGTAARLVTKGVSSSTNRQGTQSGLGYLPSYGHLKGVVLYARPLYDWKRQLACMYRAVSSRARHLLVAWSPPSSDCLMVCAISAALARLFKHAACFAVLICLEVMFCVLRSLAGQLWSLLPLTSKISWHTARAVRGCGSVHFGACPRLIFAEESWVAALLKAANT